MRKNMQKVIAAFLSGKAASGDSKRTCSTDGSTIYSYAMPIAWKKSDGTIETAPYKTAPSATTRSQIHACELAFAVVRAGQAIQAA